MTADVEAAALLLDAAIDDRRYLLSRMLNDEQARSRSASESIAWIKSEFFIPERNGPIELYPYQEAALREAYRRDDDGNYIYSIIVWSDLKKSAKSSIAAAVALERMSNSHFGSVKIIGNDVKQADSRTAEYARRAVQLNPRLHARVSIVRYKFKFDNNSTIEAIPIDPSGEAGGNDDLIVYTEAWGLKDKKDLQMWAEQRISPTKFGKGQIWVESYAGYSGESPVLERLYETGVTHGEQIDLGIDGLEVYRNDRQLTLWNTQPRLPWQTPDYYAAEAKDLTDAEFNRIHRNTWAAPQSKFVPDTWWAACKRDSLPVMKRNEPMVLALDAAESDDCFAIVMGSKHDQEIATRYARKWQPVKGQKIIYVNEDNPDDTDYPEGEIRRLAREYNIVELAYDKFQLHDMANRLRRKIGINCYSFKQGDDRAVADKQLYDLIKERRIIHSGESDLAEHINNAHQKAEGNKLRIVKGTSHAKKIDLAVCTSMMAHRCFKLNL